MPTYEYKCKKCGEKFDVRLGFFHDKKSVRCPRCNSDEATRVFSPFATDSKGGSSCAPRPFGFG